MFVMSIKNSANKSQTTRQCDVKTHTRGIMATLHNKEETQYIDKLFQRWMNKDKKFNDYLSQKINKWFCDYFHTWVNGDQNTHNRNNPQDVDKIQQSPN